MPYQPSTSRPTYLAAPPHVHTAPSLRPPSSPAATLTVKPEPISSSPSLVISLTITSTSLSSHPPRCPRLHLHLCLHPYQRGTHRPFVITVVVIVIFSSAWAHLIKTLSSSISSSTSPIFLSSSSNHRADCTNSDPSDPLSSVLEKSRRRCPRAIVSAKTYPRFSTPSSR
jgi:hypothetical protein